MSEPRKQRTLRERLKKTIEVEMELGLQGWVGKMRYTCITPAEALSVLRSFATDLEAEVEGEAMRSLRHQGGAGTRTDRRGAA